MSDTVVLLTSPVPGHRAGDVIAGKYRLERELGRGAMGTVWSAMHTTLGQRVAIKLISGDQAQSVDARHRFALEAKAAARLRSRHVVQVYDNGETPEGTPYIVMEYLDGETLEERLERQRDVSLAEAVRITSHVGRALARAHAQGIIHRDLKSGNIFLAKSEDDEIGWVGKVLDFGVAKLTDAHGPSTTKTGTIVGTPLFMSPEQIRGASHVDHRADLYSLGMVFYNMVTGSHAFDGPSYSDVLVSICTQTLPDIRVAAPWLPPAVRTWFDKACARERDERFQSADEMIEALQTAAGPAARMGPPSIPDEMGGPSGTLVGFASPEANLGMAATELGAERPSPPHELSPISSGTLRSRTAGRDLSTVRPAPKPTSGLVLWAAAGVALAVLAMLASTALSGNDTAENDSGASRASVSQPPPLPAEPIPSPQDLALSPPPPLPPPATAEPEAVTPPAELPAQAERPRSELPRASTSKPRSSPPLPRAQSTPPATVANPPKRPPPAAAPDMGF